MKYLKNNKGITLILLMLYIILALIILGILGLITSTFKGNVKDMNAKSIQDVVFDKLNVQLLKETKNEKNTINIDETNETQVVFTNGNKYTYADKAVYLNDNIKIAENIEECKFEIKTKKHIVSENTQYIDKNEDVAVIPEGFAVSGVDSERTIQNGLVIYCGIPDSVISLTTTVEVMGVTRITEYILAYDGSIDWSDGESVAEAQKTYDQFVWIPVDDINDMYMCQSEGMDTDGSGTIEDDEYSSCNITVQEVDEEEVAYCTTHSSTAMAGRLYALTEGENFNTELRTQTYVSGLREPEIIAEYDNDSTYLGHLNAILGTSYSNANNFKSDLQIEYNAIVKSIYENKGFYIGRYETSNITKIDETAIEVVKDAEDGRGGNGLNWYYMYAQMKDYSKNKELSVGSTMIQGAAYDQVIKFVHTTNYDVTKPGNVSHDLGLNDHYASGGTNYTGTIPYNDMSKNIYDLEGNAVAWTIEVKYVLNERSYRGGDFIAKEQSASYRNYAEPTTYAGNFGTICQLYIK